MTLNIAILAAGVLVFASLSLCLLVLADRERRRHIARLRRVRTQTTAPLVRTRKRHVPAVKGSVFNRLEQQMAQTNLRLSVTELLVQVGIGVLAIYALSVLVLGLNPLLALPLAAVLPVLAAAWIIRFAQNRYQGAFTAELPEALDVFARGLRAGRPISDSLSVVVENAKGPIRHEFARCHDEICMGTTLSDSLERLEHRIPTPEVSFFSVATSLQAETGGNMIETMEGLATQLRERRQLRKKARALSSEARASAVILASLPFAVALVIGLLNGAYLEPLYADPRGQIMALGAVSSISVGVFMMVQMGKLDV